VPLGQRYIPGNGIELAPTAALDFCQPGKIPAGNQQIHELQHELHLAEFIGMVHVARWEPAWSDLRGQDFFKRVGKLIRRDLSVGMGSIFFLPLSGAEIDFATCNLRNMLQYASICFNMLQ